MPFSSSLDRRPLPALRGRGQVVPRDWRILPAVVAAGLWVLALAAGLALPGQVRSARTVMLQSTDHEGVSFFTPTLTFALVFLLLAVAHGLSVLAHGAALPVRVARWATWAAFLGAVSLASWVQAHPTACVLGCGRLG